MFWCSNETAGFNRTVRLKWTRRLPNSGAEEQAHETVDAANWRQRGQAHYLSYVESVDGPLQDVRTTLRIERDTLTWTRHGAFTWTHTFREGERHASRMQVGGQTLNVETNTHLLQIDVTEAGGEIQLVYEMAIDTEEAQVELSLSFG